MATRCHLLALPAELREQIYNLCLCPTGVLHLTTTKSKRHATSPILAPALLATNRQINREASDLLLANEICLILDAHDTCWPIISETRLPQNVLEKLEHVFFILDCTSNFRASYEDVDFTALEALISLKKLRLAVMFDEASGLEDVFEEFNALTEILSRVPAKTEFVSEVVEGSQQAEYVREAIENRMGHVNNWSNGGLIPRHAARIIKTIRQDALKAAVDAVEPDVRGSKSGGSSDVFAAYRGDRGSRFGARFTGQPDFAV